MYTDKDSDVICSICIKWSQADFVRSSLFTGHGHPYLLDTYVIRIGYGAVFKVPNSYARIKANIKSIASQLRSTCVVCVSLYGGQDFVLVILTEKYACGSCIHG